MRLCSIGREVFVWNAVAFSWSFVFLLTYGDDLLLSLCAFIFYVSHTQTHINGILCAFLSQVLKESHPSENSKGGEAH
jgi:hypothetical protein